MENKSISVPELESYVIKTSLIRISSPLNDTLSHSVAHMRLRVHKSVLQVTNRTMTGFILMNCLQNTLLILFLNT